MDKDVVVASEIYRKERKQIIQTNTYNIAKRQIELNLFEESDKDIEEKINAIGRKFAKARLEKGYSLRNVDALVGKNVRTCLSALEIGNVNVNPTLKNILLIGKCLGISYEDIFIEYDVDKVMELIDRLTVGEKKQILRKMFDEALEENRWEGTKNE